MVPLEFPRLIHPLASFTFGVYLVVSISLYAGPKGKAERTEKLTGSIIDSSGSEQGKSARARSSARPVTTLIVIKSCILEDDRPAAHRGEKLGVHYSAA